jgi:hypothetical protein
MFRNPAIGLSYVILLGLAAKVERWSKFFHLADGDAMLEAVTQEKAEEPAQAKTHTARQRLWASDQICQPQASILMQLSLDISHATDSASIAGQQLGVQDIANREDFIMGIDHGPLPSTGDDFKRQ